MRGYLTGFFLATLLFASLLAAPSFALGTDERQVTSGRSILHRHGRSHGQGNRFVYLPDHQRRSHDTTGRFLDQILIGTIVRLLIVIAVVRWRRRRKGEERQSWCAQGLDYAAPRLSGD